MGRLGFSCQLANLAYSHADPAVLIQAMRDLLGLDLLEVAHSDATDAHALLCKDPCDGVWIAFRGTQCLQDGLIDAEALPVLTDLFMPGDRVHNGFLTAWNSIRTTLLQSLVTMGARHVTVVGHSLGGALATLAAYDIVLQGAGDITVEAITFGSPRVGSPYFCTGYDQAVGNTVRVVHCEDLVPTVPDWGYGHVAGELRLDASGAAVGAVRSWWGRLMGWDRQALADIDGVALHDHFLAGYQSAVSKYEAARG